MTTKNRDIQISDLNAEIERIGLVAYDNCEVTALDEEATAVPPYGIVRLSWGVGETDYYRAAELAEALTEIEDDADPDTVLNDFPAPVEEEIVKAIEEVARKEQELEQVRRELARTRQEWHFRQPVSFADFHPVRYVRGGNTDYCYGERGEVVECWTGNVIKDEKRCYAVQPSADVERINTEIAELLRAE